MFRFILIVSILLMGCKILDNEKLDSNKTITPGVYIEVLLSSDSLIAYNYPITYNSNGSYKQSESSNGCIMVERAGNWKIRLDTLFISQIQNRQREFNCEGNWKSIESAGGEIGLKIRNITPTSFEILPLPYPSDQANPWVKFKKIGAGE